MHEVSLAGGILRMLEETARSNPFKRVLCMRLEAGSLSGVDIRALEFALSAIAPGTLLQGADITITEPPGQAWCMVCAQQVDIAQRGDACSRCGGFQLLPNGGTKLRVVDMEVADD